MSGSSASPIVSRSTSFSFRASGSAMPWLSLRWRTASGSSVPAAADEPSRLRPKRAPSSSAQSISFSVTAGVSPLCARSTSTAASRPEAAVEPAAVRHGVDVRADDDDLVGLAGDRRPQVPGDVALDGGVGLGQLAEQPLARRAPILAPRQPARPVRPTRQLRQLVQVLERTLPVEVRHARDDRGDPRGRLAGARSLEDRFADLRATPVRGGFFSRMIRWRRIIGVLACPFRPAHGHRRAASPYARAVLVSCDRTCARRSSRAAW